MSRERRDGAGKPPQSRPFRSPLRWLYEFLVEEVHDDQPGSSGGKRSVRSGNQRGLPGVLYGAGVCLGGAMVFLVITHRAPTTYQPQAATATAAQPAAKLKSSTSAVHGQKARTASASGGSAAPVAAGSPACAWISTQATLVPPAAGSTRPAVMGLCEALNGADWVVGCATGFSASCGPALKPELACLRQAHHAITTADVQTCAAQVERNLAGASG